MTPTTEAGKRFVVKTSGLDLNYGRFEALAADVATIEAEARADLARRIEARVEALPGSIGHATCLDAVAARAAIREEAAR